MIPFRKPLAVVLEQRRWEVFIRICQADGEILEYVVSADATYTGESGIYFGTKQEWEEMKGDHPKCPDCGNDPKGEFWAIIGGTTGEVIGMCVDKADVLAEESDATFRPITHDEYCKVKDD